jgi:EAL domain-containing protein (putative c-di-GMP-specific phosphodiesterase class I)
MFEGLERITYQPNDQIFQEGDEGDCAYLIENGSVELSILQKKEIFKIGILEKNDLFGEMALIDKRPRMATVTVLEETQVVRIPRNLIEEKLTNVDPIIEHLLRLVLKRFRQSHHSLMGNDQFASEKVGEELDEDFSKTQENLILHVSIASDIQDGLKRDEFQLNYQPIISIMDNRVVGFEALIRWNHPKHGLMLPVKFLDIADSTDQILAIGIWTLERICRDFKTFFENTRNSSKQAPLFVSINMSARQLAKAEHVAQFANILHSARVDPNCIRLEISEALLSDQIKHARMVLSALRGQGFRLSLDNFGTGNSGLSHLQKFPIENIKIDQSFISSMLSDYDSMQIVKASIDLAKALDMEIVAEGVDSMGVLEKLLKMDCTYAQGYYIARPMPQAETTKYLSQMLPIPECDLDNEIKKEV